MTTEELQKVKVKGTMITETDQIKGTENSRVTIQHADGDITTYIVTEEKYEFKNWLITISNFLWKEIDGELDFHRKEIHFTGFATPTKYAHLLNMDNYDDYFEIGEQNNLIFNWDEDGDLICEDAEFDYIVAEPDDKYLHNYDEDRINTQKSIFVLEYLVKEILSKINPIKNAADYWMQCRGLRFSDTKFVVLKQIQRKSPAPKVGKRKSGFLSQAWAALVKKRDEKCTKCKSVYDLHAHHIKPYKDFEELRYDVNNGITLCGSCHRDLHKKNGR